MDRVGSFGVLRAECQDAPVVRFPDSRRESAARAFPSERLSGWPEGRAPRDRLQWRDRVGVAPTSRNRRGHRMTGRGV